MALCFFLPASLSRHMWLWSLGLILGGDIQQASAGCQAEEAWDFSWSEKNWPLQSPRAASLGPLLHADPSPVQPEMLGPLGTPGVKRWGVLRPFISASPHPFPCFLFILANTHRLQVLSTHTPNAISFHHSPSHC